MNLDTKYMTVVYEVGPETPNPFTTESPLGRCVAAGIGDEFIVRSAVDYALNEASDGLEWLREWADGGEKAEAELRDWMHRP